MQEKNQQLIELPELESVEFKNWKDLQFGGVYFCMLAGILVYPITKLWRYVDVRGEWFIAILGFLCLWLLIRILCADLYWRTDFHGLTVNGILRRRFIRWNEIRDISLHCSTLTKEISYKLKTDKGKVTIPSRSEISINSGRELAASVWQHLNRAGKSNGFILSNETLSFWDTIPDSLPRRIECNGRSRRADAIGGVILVAFFTASIMWMASQAKMILMALGMMPIVVLIASIIYREGFSAAESVVLDNDYIEAKTISRTIRLNWTDVASASWERNYLVIRSSYGEQIWIEYLRASKNYGKLILAVIRRLRELGSLVPIIIPNDLRVKQASERKTSILQADKDTVELKPTVVEKLFGGVAIIMLLGLLIVAVNSVTHNTMLTALAGVLIYAFGVWVIGSYKYRADHDCIEKRFLWWGRSVRWVDVKGYDNWRTQKSHYQKWILRNSVGRKLIDITLDTGSSKDKLIFENYLRIKLAEISPPEASDWMAIPV